MKRITGFEPLSDEAKARLAKLVEMPDSDIDTSEMKEWTVEDFASVLLIKRLQKFHDESGFRIT